jgi:hypothetical protein
MKKLSLVLFFFTIIDSFAMDIIEQNAMVRQEPNTRPTYSFCTFSLARNCPNPDNTIAVCPICNTKGKCIFVFDVSCKSLFMTTHFFVYCARCGYLYRDRQELQAAINKANNIPLPNVDSSQSQL